ncbi:hypothetical protein AYO40_05080 [Planctomycetaceae bacterium SCGC AG-212-D15]|nr:hypothetical protein AYO40_05080 [Planctomycetaceae bacterium SCGC AG-212-D15]
MKIRFHVTYGMSEFPSDHDGPVVNFGRGPDNTLSFPAAAGSSVDWNHARLELTPEGAFLEDQHSEGGTYLNDRRIAERTRVVLGDQIMLGAGGPLLKIDGLSLTGEDLPILLEEVNIRRPASVAAAPTSAPASAPRRPRARPEPVEAPESSSVSILGTIIVTFLALIALALTVAVVGYIVVSRRRAPVEKPVEPAPATSMAKPLSPPSRESARR